MNGVAVILENVQFLVYVCGSRRNPPAGQIWPTLRKGYLKTSLVVTSGC